MRSTTRTCMLPLSLLLLAAASLPAQQTASQWVWYPERPAGDAVREDRFFRKTFDLPAKPAEASLWLLVDDRQTLWVNGRGPLEPVEEQQHSRRFDLGTLLGAGRNVLAVQAWNGGGPAGVIARLAVKLPDGREVLVHSDASWLASKTEAPGWTEPGFDDAAWQPVRLIGSAFAAPWFDIPSFHMPPFITAAELDGYQRHMQTLTALPEGLAGEQPTRAEIKPHKGAPALFINGVPRPLVKYRGTVDPFTEQGRKILGQFRDAGIHAYAPYVTLDRCWIAPGQYDFTVVDNIARAYLSVDPEAVLDILVRLVPPRWWLDAHSEEMVGYGTSDQIDSADEAGRVLRPSLASEAWLKDAGQVWSALIRHAESQPWGKRAIGWHACYGIYAEWHYFGSWTQQYPDTGPAMTRAFRHWLRDKYADDRKLQAAWNDPQASLDTAEVPGVPPRRESTLGSLRDPQQEQRVIDYYRCHQKVVADDIEYFGRLAKEATGGRALYGIYYGYFQGVLPQTQGGHLELMRLLKSPVIDYFVAPYDYGFRLMGQDGRLRSLSAAFNLAGKAHIIEADTRTFIHPREQHGRTANLTESLAAIRREFSTSLTEHTGYWYVDFGPESAGGWYDHPEIMKAIKDLYGVAERALQVPRRSVAEVALICDLDSAYYLSDGAGMATAYRLIRETTGELYRTGAPFDAILLPQLEQADLSQYKVLIFLNTTAMSDRQAELVGRLRSSGRQATVFLWAPGLTGPDGVSLARVEQATGFKVAQQARQSAGRAVVTLTDHPLVRDLPASEQFQLEPESATAMAGFGEPARWTNPRTPLFMEQHYQQYQVKAAGGGVLWTVQTTDNWSDLHWKGEIAPAVGLGLKVRMTGTLPQIELRCVIKDANLAEFVAPAEALPRDQWRELSIPVQAFTNAPWSAQKPPQPAWPLQGMKFVIDGISNAAVTLEMQGLSALSGKITGRKVCHFGDGAAFGPLVAPVAAPGVTALGHVEAQPEALLAVRGEGTKLSLYCPVPFLPREILAVVLAQAGVHVYDTDPADVLRADSRFLAIHTKAGGPRRLSFPLPVAVHEAISGKLLGQGGSLDLQLPPNSTAILEMKAP